VNDIVAGVQGRTGVGRVALVTGGARGIGRGISEALVADGVGVAVTYIRNRELADEFVAQTESAGGCAVAIHADVADPDDCSSAVREAEEAFGRLDILVSNAGIASRGNQIAETNPAELERVLKVHALGPHNLCQAALPHLRKRPGSSIVFISSVATDLYSAGGAPYAMGKAAVEALAHTLAKEERSYGTRVNIVAPGLVRTEMGRRLARATRGVDDIDELNERSPFGHVCTPEEIGSVVRFLVSTDAAYVNDQRIVVDGGTF
jgi:3-oxoacyl-[acyl-carrier protein] reductase